MVSIDGSDISGVTIDGTDIQEITVDGDVVWTAFSADHRFPLDEGSGTTINNVQGTPDGSLTSDSFTADSDLVGGYGIIPSNGYGQINSGFGYDDTNSFTFAVTVDRPELDDTNQGQILWHQGDGSIAVVMGIDQNMSELSTAIPVGIGIYSGGWLFEQGINIDGEEGSSGKIRVAGIYDSGSYGGMYANGSEISTQSTPLNLSALNSENEIGAENGSNQFSGTVDNPAWYSRSLTASEIQTDYNEQPWS